MTRLTLLALLYLANPLTYAWWQTTGGAFPDSIGYLTLADTLLAHGELALTGQGHVDTGLILPPLYPLLIGLGSLVHGDPVLVSQWLSGVLLLAAMVPLFLWVERATNAWLAAATVAVTQWQPVYLMYGTSTLTEGLFVLGLCGLGFATTHLLERAQGRRRDWLLLGAALFALYLVRHLGLILLPIVLGVIVGVRALQRRHRAGLVAAQCALVLAGFAAVAAPFAAALYAQTGQPPWIQRYRLHEYAVTGTVPPAAQARVTPENYREVLIERRQLRRLNAEGTEMLGDLVPPAGERRGKRLSEWLAAPAQGLDNLRANLAHALAQLGPAALITAALGVALALRRREEPGFTARATLAGIAVGYVLLLSMVTGVVARYMEVLAPLVIALGCTGIHGLAELLPARKPWPAWLAIAAVVSTLFLLPVIASVPAPRQHKYGVATNPLAACRELVEPGAGVFAFHPVHPYLLGGRFRVVPNDTLDRVAAYGRLTGSRWLLFKPDAATLEEVLLYDNAPWLQDPAELFRNPNYAARCASPDGQAVLFEIVPQPAPTPKVGGAAG